MPIIYPRILTIPMQETTLQIQRMTLATPTRDGEIQMVEVGPARWVATFTTSPPRSYNEWDEWMAFIDTLRGGMATFRAGDSSRARPIAYPNGVPGWDGSATVFNVSAYSIGLSGLPANLQLSVGDHLNLEKAGTRGLYRVTEAVTAGGGGNANVSVEPAVLTNIFDTSFTANFYTPRAVFRLDPQSIVATKSRSFEPISFAGIQVLR